MKFGKYFKKGRENEDIDQKEIEKQTFHLST
jgi:hypothetical protein